MLRHVLLGMGVTLIILSLVLMAGGLLPASSSSTPQLTEQKIINRARKLGMEFPGANYTQGITLESGVDLAASLEQMEKAETPQTVETKAEEKVGSAEKKEQQTAEKKSKSKTGQQNNTQQEKIKLTITKGMQGWEVADLLVEKGVVKDRDVFINLLQKFDIEDKIMAGDYEFKPGVSKLEVLLEVTSD